MRAGPKAGCRAEASPARIAGLSSGRAEASRVLLAAAALMPPLPSTPTRNRAPAPAPPCPESDPRPRSRAPRARAPALSTCACTAPVGGLLAAARRLPYCHAPARLPCTGGWAPCCRHPYCRCAARDAALRWHAGWRLSARWTGWRAQKFPSHRAFTAAALLTSPALAPVPSLDWIY